MIAVNSYRCDHDVIDPLEFARVFWPDVYFYDKQRDVIYSVANDDETLVPAGNKLGKDFVAAFICLWFFLTRNPVRIVTTSAKGDHLRVLWSEINRAIQRSSLPSDRSRRNVLDCKEGGPLQIMHQDIRKLVGPSKKRCPISYIWGMVAGDESAAAFQGHHANPDGVVEANDGVPRTLMVADECSSIRNEVKDMTDTWRHRFLGIGNTWDCQSWWKWSIVGQRGTEERGGNIPRPDGDGFNRRVIQITAEHSPNVKLGLLQEARGERPTGEVIVPGVKTWKEFELHRRTWNEIKKKVALYAQFHEGADIKLFPPHWIDRALLLGQRFSGGSALRVAKGIGIDPAAGGDRTAMAAVDEWGLIELVSRKTPDTTDVVTEAIAFMQRHRCEDRRVLFDAGGGGKQHADRMRKMGYKRVREIGFGEEVAKEIKRVQDTIDVRKDVKSEHYAYFNRRAQMYGQLRQAIDPNSESFPNGFAIPSGPGHDWTVELVRQMSPIPLTYDGEERLKLLPKRRTNANSEQLTLTDIIGCSPDEADAVVLAIHAMLHKGTKVVAGSTSTRRG